ncbi:MAG: flagellar hook-associated protein FlgK [Clostridiales bacterium]|jgi:flagellar hook-associated protein 1 FlgK|nr:flagellar hook-associated protein FlgK [Clostridiales bacterium]MDR2749856.1 flagellar hook-associated protein FlgK [Clostridiales bacterium]
MGMSSLGIAVSGLNAAQEGLYVTGHNVANTGTPGYSRQRVLQKDYSYREVGVGSVNFMQVGLGVVMDAVRQIRDRFLDDAFRNENGRLGFYSGRAETGLEIESIMGETQSQYNFQSVMQDLWNSLNELSSHPDGIETRGNFVATSYSFIAKSDDAYSRLSSLQRSLDQQARSAVDDVNRLVAEIHRMNQEITSSELAGDRANDYRDQRNLALDELCGIIPLEIKEKKDGRVDLICEGKELLANGWQSKVGLRFVSADYAYVEPVLTASERILSAGAPADEYEPLFSFDRPADAGHYNDYGSLKGLLMARGFGPGNYLGLAGVQTPVAPPATDPTYQSYLSLKRNSDLQAFGISYCMVPMAQNKLDLVVNKIATMVNDAFAPALNGVQSPDGPYDMFGKQSYTEIFMRKRYPRWTGAGALIEPDPGDYYTQYTMGNMIVNPEIMKDGGFNLIALSPAPAGDRDDNRLLNSLIRQWNEESVQIGGEYFSINDAYRKLVTGAGAQTAECRGFMNAQERLVEQAQLKRGYVKDVSLDEELRNMMMYQHAYNSSAKILNVIDSMLDRVINGMGA